MNTLQVDHMEIAARCFALDKAREIRGVIVDHVLVEAGVREDNVDDAERAEEFAERFLAAWLKRHLTDFTRTYYADMEERVKAAENIVADLRNSTL